MWLNWVAVDDVVESIVNNPHRVHIGDLQLMYYNDMKEGEDTRGQEQACSVTVEDIQESQRQWRKYNSFLDIMIFAFFDSV